MKSENTGKHLPHSTVLCGPGGAARERTSAGLPHQQSPFFTPSARNTPHPAQPGPSQRLHGSYPGLSYDFSASSHLRLSAWSSLSSTSAPISPTVGAGCSLLPHNVHRCGPPCPDHVCRRQGVQAPAHRWGPDVIFPHYTRTEDVYGF